MFFFVFTIAALFVGVVIFWIYFMPSTNKNKNIESYHARHSEPVEKPFDPNTINPKVVELLKLIEERGLKRENNEFGDDVYKIKDCPSDVRIELNTETRGFIDFSIGDKSIYALLDKPEQREYVRSRLIKAMDTMCAEEKHIEAKNLESKLSIFLDEVNRTQQN